MTSASTLVTSASGFSPEAQSLPLCTVANVGNPPSSVGVWPSYEGLTYDLNNAEFRQIGLPVSPSAPAGERGAKSREVCLHSLENQAASTLAQARRRDNLPGIHCEPKPLPKHKHRILTTPQSWPTRTPGRQLTTQITATLTSRLPFSWRLHSVQDLSEQSPQRIRSRTLSHPCMDDWCALFNTYKSQGGNLYLQTQTPNAFITTPLTGNSQQRSHPCANPCTGTFSGSNFPAGDTIAGMNCLLNAGPPPKDDAACGPKWNFGRDGLHLRFPHVMSKPNGRNAEAVGVTTFLTRYLYATGNNASTIEVYFCDWEYAYNNIGSGALGCQKSDFTYTRKCLQRVYSATPINQPG